MTTTAKTQAALIPEISPLELRQMALSVTDVDKETRLLVLRQLQEGSEDLAKEAAFDILEIAKDMDFESKRAASRILGYTDYNPLNLTDIFKSEKDPSEDPKQVDEMNMYVEEALWQEVLQEMGRHELGSRLNNATNLVEMVKAIPRPLRAKFWELYKEKFGPMLI